MREDHQKDPMVISSNLLRKPEGGKLNIDNIPANILFAEGDISVLFTGQNHSEKILTITV